MGFYIANIGNFYQNCFMGRRRYFIHLYNRTNINTTPAQARVVFYFELFCMDNRNKREKD